MKPFTYIFHRILPLRPPGVVFQERATHSSSMTYRQTSTGHTKKGKTNMKHRLLKSSLAALAIAASFVLVSSWSSRAQAPSSTRELDGSVQAGGKPIAGAMVTLYAAGTAAPAKLAEGKTDEQGGFKLGFGQTPADSVLYIVAKGGTPKAAVSKGSSDAIMLLAVLNNKAPQNLVVNEFTTVASAFTAARFIHRESISGNLLGLRIAAGNVPNFVNLETGSWGKVVIDPFNSYRSTTLAKFDTLASLVTYAATSASDEWRGRFFTAATPDGGSKPSNTLEAMAGIARQSWAHPNDLFAAFDEAYPQPKDGSLRSAPFLPYLAYKPRDFALFLWFAGGGTDSSGRLMFDADGNAWIGNNWMPGSQSSVTLNIGGGLAKLAPDGTPLSPPIVGFRGGEIDSMGWGGAVTLKNVWAPSLNGRILVADFDGRPVATPNDFPVRLENASLMGTGIARNGDVWIADSSDDQLLFFPGGSVKDEKTVKPPGLKSPFDVVVDAQNQVWVSNSQSDTVTRFPINDPNSMKTFRVGLSPRGLALDSKNNVWVVSVISPKDLQYIPRVPDGASIMEQFRVMLGGLFRAIASGRIKATGFISMIRPDGTQPTPNAFSGNGGVNLPWGINIDGNDDVWTTNGMLGGAVYLAGDATKGHPAGTKTGDVLHVFYDGTLQILTDISIDPAGDVWICNNWNDLPVATGATTGLVPGLTAPSDKSTWGGGWGITVMYGAAAPVKPPKMGTVQGY